MRAEPRATGWTRSATSGERAARPLLVELMGPAGAGKTTVLRALGAADPRLRAGFRVERGVAAVPWIVRSGLALAPMMGSLARRAPHMLVDNSIGLLRLKVFEFALPAWHAAGQRALLLDEGPLFLLARLRVHSVRAPAIETVSTFWYRAREHWRRTIDAIIWLDATDDTLIARIRARRKRHRVKQVDDDQTRRFLAHYRAAYREVLSPRKGDAPLQVLAHDTTSLRLSEVAERVLAQLGTLIDEAPPRGDGTAA